MDGSVTRSSRRAPALILQGRAADTGETSYSFRLPCPPVPTLGVYAAHAVERRAKKVYFAVLDAMRTGTVDPDVRARLARLIAEARPKADDVLRHLMRVLDAVARNARETGGRPLLEVPPMPIEELHIEITAAAADRSRGKSASELLQWPVEWMQTRGLALAKRLQVSLSSTRG